MTVWFTSDTHFNHSNIIEYAERPFSDVEEMNETLIKKWNDRVGVDDHVYHLGDFALGRAKDVSNIIDRLNGKIHLIIGNHESCAQKRINRNKFQWIKRYYELNLGHYNPKLNDVSIVLFHFPIETWNKSHYGQLHFHGHVHSSMPKTALNRFDVGVDAWDYRPVSLEEFMTTYIES